MTLHGRRRATKTAIQAMEQHLCNGCSRRENNDHLEGFFELSQRCARHNGKLQGRSRPERVHQQSHPGPGLDTQVACLLRCDALQYLQGNDAPLLHDDVQKQGFRPLVRFMLARKLQGRGVTCKTIASTGRRGPLEAPGSPWMPSPNSISPGRILH